LRAPCAKKIFAYRTVTASMPAAIGVTMPVIAIVAIAIGAAIAIAVAVVAAAIAIVTAVSVSGSVAITGIVADDGRRRRGG
jgi:hypothetical protein